MRRIKMRKLVVVAAALCSISVGASVASANYAYKATGPHCGYCSFGSGLISQSSPHRSFSAIFNNGGGWRNYFEYNGATVGQATTTGNPVSWSNPNPTYKTEAVCYNANASQVTTTCWTDAT